MIENISGFFAVFREVKQWQITINIVRRERYKFFTTKIYSKERTVIKTTLKTFNLCSSYYGRSRYFFDGHKLPARANGTKREAIWYSELYLPFFGRYANYPKRQRLPKKTKYFCGKRSHNSEYLQLRKRLTKSKLCGDEVSYTFWEKTAKTSPRR